MVGCGGLVGGQNCNELWVTSKTVLGYKAGYSSGLQSLQSSGLQAYLIINKSKY